MSDGNDQTENPVARPPLGLPIGSVRALITLLVIAVVVVETLRGNKLPELWSETLLIAAGYYFTSRRLLNVSGPELERLEREGAVALERNPLYLPRYTMRAVILAAFAGLAYHLYAVQNVRSFSDYPPILIAVGSYLLGSMVRGLFSLGSRTRQPRRSRLLDDLKAIAVIATVVAVALAYFLDRGELMPEPVKNGALAVVLFYFGSR
ncbi:MAG: hypothetical protein EHM42_08570 [Planctomycetaceae bacterium]|nr:MAG: hypothetical protein EHM42_08570 [Planctomycetaceae bacterium]